MSGAGRLLHAGASFALVLAAAGAAAQPASVSGGDPIRCWWRTSSGSVAIGEPFTASLTCAVRADPTTDVVLDESRLAAAAIQLSPFEILDGSHPADLRTATHRFLQYHYTLRLISRDAIGRDIAFPDIQLSYRVHTRAAGDAVEGRDRTYVLPGQQVRVLSLVPLGTDDIRDGAEASFAQVESLRFRARAFELAALALAALSLIVAAPAVLRLVRGRSQVEADVPRGPRPSDVLAAVSRSLARVAEQKAGGWTADLVARALVAGRLTSGVALDRPVSRQPYVQGRDVPAERLLVGRRWLRRVEETVSSATTETDLGAAIQLLPLTTPAPRRQALEDLRAALAVFTSTLYGASFEPDASALDEALTAVRQSTDRERREHRWPRSWWPASDRPKAGSRG
jgi:hypothetical protein